MAQLQVLLDASICISVLNGSSSFARQRLARYQPAETVVSSIVCFGLRTLAQRSARSTQNLRALDIFLERVGVLDLAPEDAQEAGRIRLEIHKTGQQIGMHDLVVAAQARRRSLILATKNVSEFSRIQKLEIEDWTFSTLQ